MRNMLNYVRNFLLILMCGCATVKVTDGIPNLQVVDAGFYRSGQPDATGFSWLLQHEHDQNGHFTILKLNEVTEGSDSFARSIGITVADFPITFDQQMGIDPIDMVGLERDIKWLPHYGALIHCSHGQDRTGLAVAMHRVLCDGWSKEAAEKEMLANGFHKELAGLWYAWKQFNPPIKH